MFEEKGLSGNSPYTTWAEQLREGDQQVDGEDEQFAHGANGTVTASACKTAQRGQIASHYEFATHTLTASKTAFDGLTFSAENQSKHKWNVTLPAGYAAQRQSLQREQVLRAGARLAQVLQELFP